MDGRRRVVMWRHGQTVWNVQGRFQGQLDVDLDETGVAQAERAALLLAALSPEVIISSDLRRAADTAAALARVTGRDVTYDAALRERHGGAWQGLSGEEIRTRYPAEYVRWQPPGGETEKQVTDRFVPVVCRALEKMTNGGTLVVVSHGGAIRAGIACMLDLPPALWSRLGSLANCSWSVLGPHARGWRLVEHNAGSLPEPVRGDDQ